MHGHSFHADTECLLLPILCPDEVWRQPESIPDCARDQANETKPRLSCDQPRYVWYISAAIEVRTILEAPCFTIDFQAHLRGILGEVLEHQFLCQHQIFNKRKEFLDEIRKNTFENLDQRFLSFSSTLVGQEFCKTAGTECKSSPPSGPVQIQITACTCTIEYLFYYTVRWI